MHLAEIKSADEFLALSELIIDEDICINLRGRMMHCSACADTCPMNALTLSPNAIELDAEKCTRCNCCLPSCAAGALRSSGFVPERLLQAMAGRKEVHLHCRGSKNRGGGIVIPCHGTLDYRIMMAASAEGIGKIYLHGLTNCADCSLGEATDQVARSIEMTREYLGSQAPVFDLAPGDSGMEYKALDYQDQHHLNRRSFLRLGGANALRQAVDWIVPGLDDGEEDEDEMLPFYQADELPQRASQYAQALVARAQGLVWVEKSHNPWRIRWLSEDCSGCLSCGQRCPTGALVAVETKGKRQLSFDSALCTDCQLCEKICPEQAIGSRVAEGIRSVTEGRTLLFQLVQVPCRLCNTPFLPDGVDPEFCPVCRNEQDIDDEWLDMLSG